MPEIKVPPTEAGTQQQDERAEFIAGLRQIADFLAEHPEVQLPHLSSVQTGQMENTLDIYLAGTDQGPRLDAIADAMEEVEHVVETGYVRVFRRFAGIALVAQAKTDVTDQPWFDADEPRVWRCTVEFDRVEPVGVTKVVDGDGETWTVVDPDALVRAWTSEGREPEPLPWERLLDLCGELTEVVPPAQDGAR